MRWVVSFVVSSPTLRALPQRNETRRRRSPRQLPWLLGAVLAASPLTACQPPARAGAGQAEAGAQADPAIKTAEAPKEKRTATVPADGWNDDIAWRGFQEGLEEAKATGRPTMLVVHTSWCSKCRALKGVFNSDSTLAELSEDFVMIHVDQDVTPEVALYSPDGQYIPRVMFLDSDGKLDEELHNPMRESRFRYFYTPQEDIVATMRAALQRHGKTS